MSALTLRVCCDRDRVEWVQSERSERERESKRERENEDDAILCVVNAQAQSVQRKSINDPPKCPVKITHSDFQLQSILYIYTRYIPYSYPYRIRVFTRVERSDVRCVD